MNHRKTTVFLKKRCCRIYLAHWPFSSVFAGIAYAGPADDTSLTDSVSGSGKRAGS